ncbi:SAM-dependent methyltransferase [Thiocystis violascens]|uniref:Methyltransferase, cyclopropane fatty acid synthase n=1 Tax=Thiocystis violascens (strain ATCC 17096 / DSM 198 / 6111) TaxID=765911 RepID=I3YG29_THIV6|nr:cyclopropane-fatty-acyl-phospholipid synthase family protein [Thiocystis violascens]AFL75947.1 methyltransferase, cyclopropane fatty acid synthase [Thiocystis violascens DSM 198]
MSAEEILESPAPGGLSLAARLFGGFCGRIAFGQLMVRFPDGTATLYRGRFEGGAGVLDLKRPWMLVLRLLTRGELGFGESYVEGHWDTPDLPALLEVLLNNEEHMQSGWRGMRWSRALDRLVHRKRHNHRRNSRRNIARHYDLGNDFYRRWLDASMTYSSALFEDAGSESLEAAQQRKYERLLAALGAKSGDRILEIGCGWGGFAEVAARRGMQVTGVTLSREQLDYGRQRMAAAGLTDWVELRLQDYRDIHGQFDHAVSIEMMEAVGEAYWPTYYQTLRRLVRPGGRIALQVITISDDIFPIYRSTPDFVQIYIFPGGMLPSPQHMVQLAADAGLITQETCWYGDDYAETLRRWRARFHEVSGDIDALGYDARFRRLWDYYLAYCETGFKTGAIDLLQTVLEVPTEDRASVNA